MSFPPVRIVIQARLGSSRLPGKTMLSLAGMPALALCGRRAANRGHDVSVATTTLPQDDLVARTAAVAGLRVVRGPEQDVLARYVLAIEDLPEEAIVVRLTADNVLPDGAFMEEMVASFQRGNFDYMAPACPGDGLPYGVVAEVMTASGLREAARNAHADDDREHVSSWLIRHGRVTGFRPARTNSAWRELRATIDYLEDYERIGRVFENEADPVNVPWWELCDHLANAESHPISRNPEAVLGMANIGLANYGRVHRDGESSAAERSARVHSAIRKGIRALDCARAYGNAERIAGEAVRFYAGMHVTTKLDPMSGLETGASAGEIVARVEASISRSCSELGLKSLPVLLLHDALHLTLSGGVIWKKLLSLRDEGLVRELGASLYSPAELDAALAAPSMTHLQIPINILDRRWSRANAPERIRERAGVIVTARSVFLQGLLCASPDVWPCIPGVDAADLLRRIGKLAETLHRASVADLCLAYVLGLSWVDRIVVGVETDDQLDDLAAMWNTPALTAEECRYLEANLPDVPGELVDPRSWAGA